MTITPQTNTTLEEIAQTILSREGTFVICGHVSPDGDCIGSELALRSALVELDRTVHTLIASDGALDGAFACLPGFETMVRASSFDGKPDVFIQVDAPDASRIGEAAARIRSEASCTITIDHHAHHARETTLSYTDPDVASTTMLIWELAHHLDVDVRGDIATCSYAGLMTDTGRFQYQNTDAAAFSAAAEMVDAGADVAALSQAFFQNRTLASIQLEAVAIQNMSFLCDGDAVLSFVTAHDMEMTNAEKPDCEQLINVLRSLEGIRIAAMLRDEGHQVRGSLRAKDDTDVAAIARLFGGGGHRAAAGFTIHKPLKTARELVERAIVQACASKDIC